MKHSDSAGSSRPGDTTRIERTTRNTRQSRAAKSRTSNACEACKRRKTKCSGGPSPCDVCKRAETYCNFNPKLDTRRKVSYSSTTIQDRQQYMLTGLLQTIKHAPEDELQQLITLIRNSESSRIDSVATCLREHFTTLQGKGIIPVYDIDDTDVISFGLRGLCAYRKGPARPSSPSPKTDQASNGTHSPTALSLDGEDSSPDLDDMAVGTSRDERSPTAPSIDNDELFDPVGEFDSAEMFNHPFESHLLSHQDDDLLPFETPPGGYSQHLNTVSSSYPSHTLPADSTGLSDTFTGFPPSTNHASPHPQAAYYHQHHQNPDNPHPTFSNSNANGNTYTMMQYYASLANANNLPPTSLTSTLNPTLAMKTRVPGPESGSLPPHHHSQSAIIDPPVPNEFSHSDVLSSYAFQTQGQTLRSNA